VFNYLIRVLLPDRPGALGAVASRIGAVGGDVVSIDILEHGDGIVVDELGVGLADDRLVSLLCDEILEVDGVVVESVRPVQGALPDRQAAILAAATELIKQTSRGGLLERLVVRVRRSLTASSAVIFDLASSAVVANDGEAPDHDRLCRMAGLAVASASDRDVTGPVGGHPARTDTAGGDTAGGDTAGGDTDLQVGPAGTSVVNDDGTTVAASLDHAGLVLIVQRDEPVLRLREREWISIMADLVDHGWRQLD
jgi:hypothetical protein